MLHVSRDSNLRIPKKYRGVFVNRMQNYCLDTLECLLEANFIRMDALEKKTKREEYRKEQDNKIYFLKCDIRKYFQSIDHKVLLNLLEKVNFSDDEMWMIEKLVKEQPNNANVGLPLGNQSRKWFALLYLNVIDRYVKEDLRVKRYIRYMDDMILIHRDKSYFQYSLLKIKEKCEDELKFLLNQKTQIGIVKNGIYFLGYRHVLNENGSITR